MFMCHFLLIHVSLKKHVVKDLKLCTNQIIIVKYVSVIKSISENEV